MSLNTVHLGSVAEPKSGEGPMSVLLASLMTLVIAQHLFALPLSMGPGLSVENALLYVIAVALAFKFAVTRALKFDLRGLHACFAVLIAYAVLSIPAVTILAPFQGYKPLPSIVSFKTRMLDPFVFFAVFFYGLQGTRSAFNVLKALLAITAIANLIALLDAWGVIEAAGLVAREDGRAQGVMGESNQSAAFIAVFLPGLAALAFTTSGMARLFWIGAIVVSAVAMTISASRGGFLATIVSTMWGLVYFRRHISGRAIAIALGVGAAILVILLPLVASRYGVLLVERVIQDSTSSNLAGASSGRLDIWQVAFAKMAQSPLSLVTGFGWGSYDAMPFRYNTHNHYLSLWFDLGLAGLFCGTAALVIPIRNAMRATFNAAQLHRPILIAFSMGAVAIMVAVFFVNLYTPWLWFWAYVGLAMRIAVNTLRQNAQVRGSEVSTGADKTDTKDSFGWIGSASGALR